MSDNNPLGNVKVPAGMVAAQGFITYVKQASEEGKKIGLDELDTYLAHLSATVVEIVHTLGGIDEVLRKLRSQNS